MKKIRILLCMFILIMIGISGHVFAQGENPWIIGCDTETLGDWKNVYGKSGYLFFFGSTDLTSGRDNPPAAHIESLPPYAGVTVNSRYNYTVAGNPSSDARAPQMPDSTARKAIDVYAYGSMEIEIEITDNTSHFVSFYMPVYKELKSKRVFSVLNGSGEQIDSIEIDASKGPYVTVEANDTFRIKLVNELYPSETVSISAILFDECTTTELCGFSAEYEGRRSIGLSWFGNEKAAVFRSENGGKMKKIAVLPAGSTSYTDSNLTSGAVYSYRLRGVSGKLYSAALTVESRVESYEESFLEIQGDKERFPSACGETVKFVIAARRGEEPAPFEEICVTLDGAFVGEYIEPALGTVTTDDSGTAYFSYNPRYYGEYRLRFALGADDDRKFGGAHDEATVLLDVQEWKSAPYLSDISNEISPGEVFNVYGYGITGDVSAAAKAADGIAPGSVPEDAILLPVIQTDDSGSGFFVSVMLPDYAEAGVYDIWVKNNYGWSRPIRLNEPQGQFLTENEINSQTDIKVVGRNLAPEKFGAGGSAFVRLSDADGNRYPAIIKESNRVAITFTVSDDIPAGEYYVDVNNSEGNNWSRIKTDQTLLVKRYSADPFGLNAAWSDVFNYTDYYTESFGITANSKNNQTALFQEAINTIEKNGGGVLNIPAGTYDLSTLYMGSGVILCGAGSDDTILRYAGKGGTFILFNDSAGKNGKVGFANFSMVAADEAYLPNPWIMLGPKNSIEDARCNYVFVTDVNMNYPFVDKKNHEGIRLATEGEKVIIQNCSLHGQAAATTSGRVKRYCKIINNTFEYCAGAPHCLAEFAVIEGNNFVCNREAYLQLRELYGTQNHGMKVGSHSYYYNNYTCYTGAPPDHPLSSNDGEIAFAEAPSGTLATGKVLSADRNSLEIEVNTTAIQENGLLMIPETAFGLCSVAIIGGRGAGQYRSIKSVSGENKITVTKPWNVVPDGSSIYSIIYIFEDITFYKNRAYDCKSSLLFYQNCVDAACLENELDTTAGIQTAGFYIPSSSRGNPSWNVWFEDNTSLNQRVLNSSSIGTNGITAFTTKHYPANLLLGYEVKNNRVTAYENAALGMGCFTTGGSSKYPYFGVGALFIGNSISGFSKGMMFSKGISGVVLNDNIFENCSTDIDFGDAENISDITGTLPNPPETPVSPDPYGQLSFADPAVKSEYYPYPIEFDDISFYMETKGKMSVTDNLDRVQTGDEIKASARLLNHGNDEFFVRAYLVKFSSGGAVEQLSSAAAVIPSENNITVEVLLTNEKDFVKGDRIMFVIFDSEQRPILSAPVCGTL